MDKPAIHICEAFAKAGYPLDVEAMLIIEVEGSDGEMEAELARIVEIAKQHGVRVVKESRSALETALIWKGRKSAFGATGRVADYICMDGTVPTSQLPYVLKRTGEIVASYGLRVANVFHAGDGNMHPLILYNVNDRPNRKRRKPQAWTSCACALKRAGASRANMALGSRSGTSCATSSRKPISNSRCARAPRSIRAGCSIPRKCFRSRGG